MSRRIDVELTSSRNDGQTWTWRAAGARQPKGELDGGLLYPGANVGDVVRAEADFAIEGITIIAVQPPKGARTEPERLEIIGPPRRDEPGVTTTLAPRGRRERSDRGDRDRGDRGPRRDRPPRGRDGREGREGRDGRPGGGDREGRPRREGDRRGERRDPRPRPARPAPEPKPRAKRLRPGRVHRTAVLAALPETHRPLADELVRGGIPGLRQTLDRQNAALAADSKPRINPDPLLDIAERLMPLLRAAEWQDRAEAALADADEVDIRDLRSVVVAADQGARDDTTRALAEQLRKILGERVDREHHDWLKELAENLDQGRVVRALRLSSRPPKAGAPLPADLAGRLVEATTNSLTAEISDERYATVLDALALSPVRLQVEPGYVPEKPSDELLVAVRKVADRVPAIAGRFGVQAGKGRGRGRERSGRGGPPPGSAPNTRAGAPGRPRTPGASGAPVAPAEPSGGDQPAGEHTPPAHPQSEATPPANEARSNESIPSESIPAESIPAESIPAETVPAETVPAETTSNEPASAESGSNVTSSPEPANAGGPAADNGVPQSAPDSDANQPATS
jgi:hypothetical protein